MAKYATEAIKTPVGNLEWVTISGEGKENLNGDMQYQASLVLDVDSNEKHSAFQKQISDFWQANKPQGFKGDEPDSNGLYPHKVATGEKDEDGDSIYEETGKLVLATKTKTTFADGNEKKIKIFNSKGAEVNLGDKKVANDSRGRIGCVMAIYATTDKSGKKIINSGVTFYLNNIQLSKFIEYAGAGFDELEDEEGDDFESLDDGMAALTESDSSTAEKPRLD